MNVWEMESEIILSFKKISFKELHLLIIHQGEFHKISNLLHLLHFIIIAN